MPEAQAGVLALGVPAHRVRPLAAAERHDPRERARADVETARAYRQGGET